MTNHIWQLLAKFHQNLMKHFQIMPKKPHFLTLIPYNLRIKIFSKQVRLAMVPRNSQITLFETDIQHH